MSDTIHTEFDVPATMRDGTVLRANIFRPDGAGPFPVVLVRTPYSKEFGSVTPMLDALRLARTGYIVVIQDVRGRFRSEGEWSAFRHEQADGYDTVEWAAALPGSNGKVGMAGASYFGETQWAAATQAPPHLKAIMPVITWDDFLNGVAWRGGALELGMQAYWQVTNLAFDTMLKRFSGPPSPQMIGAMMQLLQEINTLRTEGYYSLPLQDFAPFKRLDINPDYAELIAQPYQQEAQGYASVAEHYDQVQVPAYNVGGWYDIFSQGTLRNFQHLRQAGSTPEARQAKLLMGPWSHVGYSHVIGEMDFGFAANMSFINLRTDLTSLAQRWFDYWLKDIDNGVTREPPVKLFIMGANAWRDEQEWPLARTHYTPYYLRGDGQLSRDQPGAEAPNQYIYDPADPTPTQGGAVLMHALFNPGVKDQRSVEARADVLSFTSAPLSQAVEVTGPVVVKLWAASDAPDTDFVARLVDVHPNGFAQNLTDGIIRARFRQGGLSEPLVSGRPYEFTIDLWSTANVFLPGHAIRLDIASANFPRWDRNPNTGAPFGSDAALRPARQTIFHDTAHPSHVVLPVIPR